MALGLAVALSGLWMTQFHPREGGTGILHYLCWLGFGSAMAACLAVRVFGAAAVQQHHFAAHQARMARADARPARAGTQAFTLGINESLFGASQLGSGLAPGAPEAIVLTGGEDVIARSRNGHLKHATAMQGA